VAVESVVLEPDADFSALETFYIVSTEDERGRVYESLEAAIVRQLVARGRTEAAPEQADMWIAYQANALDRQKRRNAGDPDANSYRIVSYVEGTLAVDVFEHAGVRRIWHGQALVEDRSREALRGRADRLAEAIFAEFPID
jgi:hypothetical protein